MDSQIASGYSSILIFWFNIEMDFLILLTSLFSGSSKLPFQSSVFHPPCGLWRFFLAISSVLAWFSDYALSPKSLQRAKQGTTTKLTQFINISDRSKALREIRFSSINHYLHIPLLVYIYKLPQSINNTKSILLPNLTPSNGDNKASITYFPTLESLSLANMAIGTEEIITVLFLFCTINLYKWKKKTAYRYLWNFLQVLCEIQSCRSSPKKGKGKVSTFAAGLISDHTYNIINSDKKEDQGNINHTTKSCGNDDTKINVLYCFSNINLYIYQILCMYGFLWNFLLVCVIQSFDLNPKKENYNTTSFNYKQLIYKISVPNPFVPNPTPLSGGKNHINLDQFHLLLTLNRLSVILLYAKFKTKMCTIPLTGFNGNSNICVNIKSTHYLSMMTFLFVHVWILSV